MVTVTARVHKWPQLDSGTLNFWTGQAWDEPVAREWKTGPFRLRELILADNAEAQFIERAVN